MIGQMLSPAEHLTIVGLMGHLAPLWGGPWARGSLLVMLAAAVAGAWPGASPTARFVLAVVGVMSAGYYATIVALPFDPDFLVSTTFERVFMQLWPSLVFAGFSWGEPRPRAAADAGLGVRGAA
jgi:hypothetical protein